MICVLQNKSYLGWEDRMKSGSILEAQETECVRI